MPGSFQNNCNNVETDPALAFVSAGWDKFSVYASDGYSLAVEQTGKLNDFNVDYITWNAQFEADGVLGGFVRPTRPDIPEMVIPDLTLAIPEAPSVETSPIIIGEAPAEPADLLNPPVINIPAAPDEFTVASPGDAPTMDVFALPDAPTIESLLPPALVDILVPDAPVIVIDQFAEPLPVFEGTPPSALFDFTERPYESDFLDEIKAKLQHWIATDGRVPMALSDALWGKAASRADETNLKLHQEARDAFGARGWSEPNGILRDTLMQVQQQNRNARMGLVRDVYIQEETLAIENLKFAIQQGLQLETTYLQAWLTVEQRRFEVVKAASDLTIAIFNVQVQQYNVAIAGYNARVDAYKAYLDTLRTQVAVYEAEVSAARVKGELNTQLVQAYAAQIQAQGYYADLYRSQIEGFKARIDGEKAKIDGYRSEVEAYQARVQAHGQEWDAYNSRLQAEVQKGQLYGVMVDAYGKRVQVWQTQAGVKIQENQANLATIQARLQQYDAQVRGVLARLEAAKISIDAQSSRNSSLVQVYSTDATVESTAVDADTRVFQAQTERERAKLDMVMKDAELQITQIIQRATLLLRAYESAAQSSSQLAASAFSAMNFSAGLSSSQGKSESCSTSFNFSGEIIDSGNA